VATRNNQLESPIDTALSKGHDDIVKFLREKGCVTTREQYGVS
jgi:ankyrin repeat protein